MITIRGHEYGTAQEIAARLGPDIDATNVRDWARRHLIESFRTASQTWHRLDQAAAVERQTRVSTRGRKRSA